MIMLELIQRIGYRTSIWTECSATVIKEKMNLNKGWLLDMYGQLTDLKRRENLHYRMIKSWKILD